jgi:hypothetical protein
MAECLNCEKKISKKDKFCGYCGQKTAHSTLSLWSIIATFFSNLFNIETKIWRTFRDIWIPSKLTKAFVQGKRIGYYNPLRIFLIVLFAFFTLFLLQVKEDIDNLNQINTQQEKKIWAEKLAFQFDSLAAVSSMPPDTLAIFKRKLFEVKKEKADSVIFLVGKDTLFSNKPVVKDKSIERDTTVDKRGKFSFEGNDLFVLSDKELLKKYSDGDHLKDVVMLQMQKVLKNLSSSVKFFIGNGTWAIIAVLLLMAGLFKLLYIRHDYLYAEHFIFHLYGHTRMLLLALLSMLCGHLGFKFSWIMPWICIGLIYLYVSMLMYYKQPKTKTFVKFVLTIFAYMTFLVFCFVVMIGISFMVL